MSMVLRSCGHACYHITALITSKTRLQGRFICFTFAKLVALCYIGENQYKTKTNYFAECGMMNGAVSRPRGKEMLGEMAGLCAGISLHRFY